MQDPENNESPAVPNPNQAAPVPPVAIPPVTPVDPAVMPQPPNAIPPMTPSAPPAAPQSNNSANTNDSLGTISVLSSLIPPVGLILGILSVVKGSKSKNKKLTLFGGVAILLSVIIGLLYVFVVAPRIPALAGSKYSKQKNISITTGSLNLTVPIPELYEEKTGIDNNATDNLGITYESKTYILYSDSKTKKDIVSVLSFTSVDASIIARATEQVGRKLTVEDAISSGLETSNYELEAQIGQETKSLTNIKVLSKEKSGNNGYIVNYTAEGKSSDGKKVEIVGVYSFYVTSDFNFIGINQATEKNVYNKNKKVFDGIALSVKDQIK